MNARDNAPAAPPAPTHQVVDFGPGPVDCSTYPFEGSEPACEAWVDAHKEGRRDGRARYGVQAIPEEWEPASGGRP